MSRQGNAAFAVLLAGLLGCGEEDPSDPPGLGPAPLHPVPGCESFDHRPCDVFDSACQERLMAVTACVRGGEPAPAPPVSVMTEAEYVSYLNELLAEEEPPPVPNHYEAALVMLGLAETGSQGQATVVAEQAKWVGGFYRGTTKDIVLVEHAEERDPVMNSVLLVHEYIHALQDRDVNLDAFQEEHVTTYDSFIATDSVIEGEARLHQLRYAASAFGLDPATVDWKAQFRNVIDQSMDELLAGPSVYGPAYRNFPYTWGARYAYLVFEAEGFEGLLARFASPPLTSRTVMASVDAALTDGPAAPAIPAPVPPAEWEPFTEATLGALGVHLLSELARYGRPPSVAAALAWRNDRLFVFASTPSAPSAGTAVVFRIEFATEADARAFADRLAAGDLTVGQIGTRVTIAQSNNLLGVEWGFAP